MSEVIKPMFQENQREAFNQVLMEVFDTQADTFTEDVTRFYVRSKRSEDITTTQNTIRQHVGMTVFGRESSIKPEPCVLREIAVVYPMNAAIAMSEKYPKRSHDIASFWGDMATAIVGAEYTEQVDEIPTRQGVTSDNRIYNNRGVRDQIIYEFNKSLMQHSLASYLQSDIGVSGSEMLLAAAD